MTPSVQRALAYVAITGMFPRHIHLNTWSAVYSHVTHGKDAEYVVRPESLTQIENHPMLVSHRYLLGLGFKVDRNRTGLRSTSHYVRYRRQHDAGDDEATAYRSGGATLRPYAQTRPFKSITLTHQQVLEASNRP